VIGKDGTKAWLMRERYKPGGANAAAHIEEAGAAGRHCRAEQHAIEAGAKPAGGLRHSEPATQKGVARYGLVFYKGTWLV
jgi:hypothetical protein